MQQVIKYRRTVTVPLNIGAISKSLFGPTPLYCPRMTSMKNIGRPAKANMMKYGMRNAPANRHNILQSMKCAKHMYNRRMGTSPYLGSSTFVKNKDAFITFNEQQVGH